MESQNDLEVWEFQGCVWSANECMYSCRRDKGILVEKDPELCWVDELLPLACYCEAT
jgi:hypothetical protein